AEQILRTSSIDVVITDLKMAKMGGLEVLRIAKNADPETIVILITAYPTVNTAVEAMKFGACDYLVKPFSVEQLRTVVKDALEKRKTKEAYGLLRSQLRSAFAVDGIVGQSQGILKLCDEIRKVASVSANLLILGDIGVGKELVARAIHENSARQGRPFVPINCAAIPENLLEAELFGYERGAFTGAQAAKEGLLETATGGTLFLDEFCELTPTLQAKLLRTLEENASAGLVGESRCRLTSASWPPRIETSTRKSDLDGSGKTFFSASVSSRFACRLSQRQEDIPLLVAHSLEASAKGSGKAIEGITPEAMERLTQYN